jgi:hypothetical protein
MAEHFQDQSLDTGIARMVARQVDDTTSEARDTAEHVAILKAFAAAAVFGYAELTSLAAAAQWLRLSADHVDGLAARQKGDLN